MGESCQQRYRQGKLLQGRTISRPRARIATSREVAKPKTRLVEQEAGGIGVFCNRLGRPDEPGWPRCRATN
jgi:hypothetical protein